MLDKTLKVKQATPAELASKRHDAATARDQARWNLAFMQDRRQSQPPKSPDLVEPKGFDSYVRRLERYAKAMEPATPDPAQAGAGGGGAVGLGNNTESRAGFHEDLDQKTGEIQWVRYDRDRNEYRSETPAEFVTVNARAARFSAQSSAGRLLAHEITPRGTQWRVTGCVRRKVGAEVSVLYSSKLKKAHYGGLMVCGSVWTCPPCAAKVSERRKLEVVAATDLHKSQGGGLYMVTLTAPHKRDHSLSDWLGRFSAARARMRRQRAYRELRDLVGHVGNIRALEVTYGDANGWHPHEHSLWLVSKPLSVRRLQVLRSELFDLWRAACVAEGLPPPNRKRGVDVRVMESAAEYVAKFGREPRWGVGSEMAKQHTKGGKVQSMTPFDLLRRYHEGSDDGSHRRFGALFVTFAKAFFGKRQIVWTDGLKELFGIEQRSDESIAEEESDDAVELVRITATQWRCVLHQKSDVRQVLLERAESGGYAAVVAYLEQLMDRFVPF